MKALPTDPRPLTKHPLVQSPFVQNVLPFLTSLLLHVGIVILGVATYQAVRQVMRVRVSQEQTFAQTADIAWKGPDNGVQFAGLNGDPNRRPEQDKFPDIKESDGVTDKLGKSLLPGGSKGGDDGLADAMFGIGPGRGPGHDGNNLGDGTGGGFGPGDDGRPARFGIPGGGALKFCNTPLDAGDRKIVFVCDATGSMMEQFDNLRRELRKTIDPMKVPQAANVVFMQDKAPPPVDSQVQLLTTSFKRKLLAYVDNETPRGGTDPIPALKAAFAMHPDHIFFLCDPSDFPDRQTTIDLCKSLNPGRNVKITTIAFENHDVEGEKMLKQIATDSGGMYRFVSAKELEE